jgi:hypothetical protein
MDQGQKTDDIRGRPHRSRVWWCVVVALVLHVTAWVCWFKLASLHPVAEVPLASRDHP